MLNQLQGLPTRGPTSSASSITQGISPAAENALAFQRSVPEKLSPKQPVFLNERSFGGGRGQVPFLVCS